MDVTGVLDVDDDVDDDVGDEVGDDDDHGDDNNAYFFLQRKIWSHWLWLWPGGRHPTFREKK